VEYDEVKVSERKEMDEIKDRVEHSMIVAGMAGSLEMESSSKVPCGISWNV
jgi:hypothetical protein